jgi:predicted DNA-binding transcriptional regulator YafY
LKKLVANEYDTPFYAKLPDGVKLSDSPVVKELELAVDNTQKVIVHYESPDKKGEYKVRPLKILFYDGFWYLLAQVDGKDWIIKFRLEHIKSVEVLEEIFAPPENLKTILDQSTNIWFHQDRCEKITVCVDKEIAKYFKGRVWLPLQKIVKENKDGSLIIESTVCQHMEAIPVILRWLPHVTVIKPDELKNEIIDIIEQYRARLKA